MPSPKFNIGIVGGGIGGMALAASINHFTAGRHDIHVDIYEASPHLKEIGAGVGTLLRGWKALETLGFAEPLGRLLARVPNQNELGNCFELRKSDQVEGVNYYDIRVPAGILTFHRAHFLETLANGFDQSIWFSKRLTEFSQSSSTSGPVSLTFSDGSMAEVDALVACDGINSIVRSPMLSSLAEEYAAKGDDEMAKELLDARRPVWSGSYCYRTLVPAAKLRELNPSHRCLLKCMNYTGKDKEIIAYPLSNNTFINVAAFLSSHDKAGIIHEGKAMEDRSTDELRASFEGWEEEVMQILQCAEKSSRWVINTLKCLPAYAHNRVALLGDAAHAMTPHQGQGAGQAIEDAYVLGALLSHPSTTRATLDVALKAYEQVRIPHASMVLRKSAENGRIKEFADERFADLRGRTVTEADVGHLKEMSEVIIENWKWAWETSVEDDKKRAVGLLEEMLAKHNACE